MREGGKAKGKSRDYIALLRSKIIAAPWTAEM